MVITGIGVLAANGIGKDAFWSALLANESGVGPVTLFDATDLSCRIAGEVPGFDPKVFFEPRQKAKRMGRFTQLALIATEQAVEDAGLTMEHLADIPQLPLILGVSTTAMDLRAQPPTSYSAVTGIPNAASSTIAYTYGLDAQIETISNGCASSLDAVTCAFEHVRSGKADIAIAGGTDSTITRYVFECLCKSRKVSINNENPQEACKPFDLRRDGGVAAEGAGIIIVENLATAFERNAHIYCEIQGYGRCIDPRQSAEGAGLSESMKIALMNSGILSSQIDYISAHAPGDPYMDKTESDAIKSVFGKHAYNMAVTSLKGSCGNAMAAGGIHQLIATALSINSGQIAPTTNYELPDVDCDLDYVPRIRRIQDVRNAVVNSHGFGRSNCSVVVKKYQP